MERITSVKNEHVKRITKIMSSAKERRYSGKYLVEGPRMVREIPINDLDERDRYVLDQRFIIGKTQLELAEELDISQAQVSRIEKKVIDTLKKKVE